MGHRYGDSVRVVVLSLDPGGREGKHDAKKRTLEAIQFEQGKEQPDGFHKGRHWYRTYETVSALLSHFEDAALTPGDIVGRFAHVNAAKCTQNLENRKQAPAHMFDNCRGYLEHELEILAPDVVITQGKKAAEVVASWAGGSRRRHVVRIRDHTFYWLELVHPTAHAPARGEPQPYRKEMKTWPRRFAAAKRWLDDQPSRIS